MPDTNIEIGSKRTFVADDNQPFQVGAHSDKMHGFYSGAKPFTEAAGRDTWIISITGDNGVIDVGRQGIDGKIVIRNGTQEAKVVLDGKTGATQQAGDVLTNGDLIVVRGAKVAIRLDGAEGDILLGGRDPNEARIWLEGAQGNARFGSNVRLDGTAGQVVLGGRQAAGKVLLHNAAGSQTLGLDGSTGSARFAGPIVIGTPAAGQDGMLQVSGKVSTVDLAVSGKITSAQISALQTGLDSLQAENELLRTQIMQSVQEIHEFISDGGVIDGDLRHMNSVVKDLTEALNKAQASLASHQQLLDKLGIRLDTLAQAVEAGAHP